MLTKLSKSLFKLNQLISLGLGINDGPISKSFKKKEESEQRATNVNTIFSKTVQRTFPFNKTITVKTLTLVIEVYLKISKGHNYILKRLKINILKLDEQ